MATSIFIFDVKNEMLDVMSYYWRFLFLILTCKFSLNFFSKWHGRVIWENIVDFIIKTNLEMILLPSQRLFVLLITLLIGDNNSTINSLWAYLRRVVSWNFTFIVYWHIRGNWWTIVRPSIVSIVYCWLYTFVYRSLYGFWEEKIYVMYTEKMFRIWFDAVTMEIIFDIVRSRISHLGCHLWSFSVVNYNGTRLNIVTVRFTLRTKKKR